MNVWNVTLGQTVYIWEVRNIFRFSSHRNADYRPACLLGVLGLNNGRDNHCLDWEFLKGFFTKDERSVVEMCCVAVQSNSYLSIPGSAHIRFWLSSTVLRERNSKVPYRKIGIKNP